MSWPSIWRLCRFAANKKSQHFTLGAEGSGTVAAVGPGVSDLKVTLVQPSLPDGAVGWPHQLCTSLNSSNVLGTESALMQVGDMVTVGGLGSGAFGEKQFHLVHRICFGIHMLAHDGQAS